METTKLIDKLETLINNERETIRIYSENGFPEKTIEYHRTRQFAFFMVWKALKGDSTLLDIEVSAALLKIAKVI